MRSHLPLDHAVDVRRRSGSRRRGLGRAAETDYKKNQKRAPHHHQSKPPEHEQTLDYLMAGRHPVWSLLLRWCRWQIMAHARIMTQEQSSRMRPFLSGTLRKGWVMGSSERSSECGAA
jgi:hypothetical protein